MTDLLYPSPPPYFAALLQSPNNAAGYLAAPTVYTYLLTSPSPIISSLASPRPPSCQLIPSLRPHSSLPSNIKPPLPPPLSLWGLSPVGIVNSTARAKTGLRRNDSFLLECAGCWPLHLLIIHCDSGCSVFCNSAVCISGMFAPPLASSTRDSTRTETNEWPDNSYRHCVRMLIDS